MSISVRSPISIHGDTVPDISLPATNNCHPNYVGFLLNKQTLNMKQIYQVLKEIPSDERSLYNEKLIAGLYLKFQENEIDDKDTIKELQKLIKDKKIVVVAPGKSLTDREKRSRIHETRKSLCDQRKQHTRIYHTGCSVYQQSETISSVKERTWNQRTAIPSDHNIQYSGVKGCSVYCKLLKSCDSR